MASAIQVVGAVLGAPLLLGVMRKVRCRLEGRVGPPIRQPWKDIRKLARKERLRPEQASVVFGLAPVVLLASGLVVVAVSPLVSTHQALATTSDLFVVVLLLLLGSVILALAGLDTGTAFGGMGASRAMTIGALAEPALLVAVLALAAPVHTSNLSLVVVGSLHHPAWLATPQRVLAFAAFVIVVLAESGRLPVDNPSTHLELTMVHEAMILEYSGPDLATVILGEGVRLVALLSLLATLFVPWGIATGTGLSGLGLGVVALAGKVTFFGIAIAVSEVAVAKLRLFRVPELLAGAFALAVFAVLSALVIP
ncbi:MAG: respiratory chain complex I subunit 1 family protein [Acidimicrobiales bacterium]